MTSRCIVVSPIWHNYLFIYYVRYGLVSSFVDFHCVDSLKDGKNGFALFHGFCLVGMVV